MKTRPELLDDYTRYTNLADADMARSYEKAQTYATLAVAAATAAGHTSVSADNPDDAIGPHRVTVAAGENSTAIYVDGCRVFEGGHQTVVERLCCILDITVTDAGPEHPQTLAT